VSRWLQTELPVENTQLYKNGKGRRVDHIGNQLRGEGKVLWIWGSRFLREQMRDFHDLLRQNPTSLFMLLGWSSISMASLTMR
jgi:hypothetical protein